MRLFREMFLNQWAAVPELFLVGWHTFLNLIIINKSTIISYKYTKKLPNAFILTPLNVEKRKRFKKCMMSRKKKSYSSLVGRRASFVENHCLRGPPLCRYFFFWLFQIYSKIMVPFWNGARVKAPPGYILRWRFL